MITQEDCHKLVYRIQNNQIGLNLPLLKSCFPFTSPFVSTSLYAGVCLEPFAALINHSCEPNALWHFEGRELRVTAIKNIAPGEEVTARVDFFFIFCLLGPPDYHDYQARKKQHKVNWNFTCNCDVCQLGDLGPKGGLRIKALKAVEMRMDSVSEDRFQAVSSTIRDIQKAGLRMHVYQMHTLHQILFQHYIAKDMPLNALRIAFTMYFVIEPKTIPSTSPSIRINTLYSLNHALWQVIRIPNPMKAIKNDNDMSAHITATFVLPHIQAKYVREIERCFGSDTAIAKHERKFFDALVNRFKTFNKDFQYVSLSNMYKNVKKDKKERKEFVVNMNKLLNCAGIAPMTEKELI
ncbi:hypothetical protein B0J14DRAFT_258755 [Halenospora varia]|nr:hypothetical protein B0J14DRAFT_258755 [Halenospora varia]